VSQSNLPDQLTTLYFTDCVFSLSRLRRFVLSSLRQKIAYEIDKAELIPEKFIEEKED